MKNKTTTGQKLISALKEAVQFEKGKIKLRTSRVGLGKKTSKKK